VVRTVIKEVDHRRSRYDYIEQFIRAVNEF